MKTVASMLLVLVIPVSVANGVQYLQACSFVTQCPGTAPEVVAMNRAYPLDAYTH